jgi:hypothetical protein
MKKLIFIGLIAAGSLSSCVISHNVQLTGQPIGTKTGVSKVGPFVGKDGSVKAAAQNGGITTIGALERTTKVFIIPWTITRVYGN